MRGLSHSWSHEDEDEPGWTNLPHPAHHESRLDATPGVRIWGNGTGRETRCHHLVALLPKECGTINLLRGVSVS